MRRTRRRSWSNVLTVLQLSESAFFWRDISEWHLRFLLVRLAKREMWSRKGGVLGRKLPFWRSRRLRAAALYKKKFGSVPSVYERTFLPRKRGKAFEWVLGSRDPGDGAS